MGCSSHRYILWWPFAFVAAILSLGCGGGNDDGPTNQRNITIGARDFAPGVKVLGGEVLEFRIDGVRGYMLKPWGVDVYDLSGDRPVLMGYEIFDAVESYLGASEGLIYVGSWNDQDLVIYDATAPQSIHEIGRVTTTDNVNAIVVWDDYAFCANSNAGLTVVDVSDPTKPSVLTSIGSGVYVGDVRMMGSRLYVTRSTNGIDVYDITVPSNPAQIGHIDSTWSSQTCSLKGNLLAVAEGIGDMQIVDVGDLSSPAQLGVLPVTDYGLDVAWYGDWIYLADGAAGVHVVQAGDPYSPTITGTLQTGGYARSVLVHSDRLYVTDLDGGLLVYDLSAPAAPGLLWRIEQGTGVEGLCVHNDLAYVTNRHSLSIVSLVDEVTLSSADVLTYSEEVAVANGYAFCEGNDFSAKFLDIVDVSDPEQPEYVSRYTFPPASSSVHRMIVRGNVLFLTRGSEGFEAHDISDPANPQLLDSYDTGGTALGLKLRNNLAFVGDTTNGLVVLDVQEPSNIQFVCNRPEDNTGWVALYGDYAYTSDATPRGVRVFDISDPSAPSEITSVPVGTAACYGMAVVGSRLYVASTSDGLYALDLTDPALPVVEGQLFNGRDIWKVVEWRGKAIAGDRYSGLFLIDADGVVYP